MYGSFPMTIRASSSRNHFRSTSEAQPKANALSSYCSNTVYTARICLGYSLLAGDRYSWALRPEKEQTMERRLLAPGQGISKCIRLEAPIRTTFSHCSRRPRSTDASASHNPPNSRWLSDLKQRIGKCITFGLKPNQTREVGAIMQEISRDWRELVAGSEGFLTSPHRRGLYRRRVIWGEQDAMV